jgi:hypothetical protein
MNLTRDEHKDWKFITATLLAIIAIFTFAIARDVSKVLEIIDLWNSEESHSHYNPVCNFASK